MQRQPEHAVHQLSPIRSGVHWKWGNRPQIGVTEALNTPFKLALPHSFLFESCCMHSLSPEYLAQLRFGTQQLATLRALGEYRGKQQLFVAQSPEVLRDLRQVAIREIHVWSS